MRASTLILAGLLSLPGLGALAQTGPLSGTGGATVAQSREPDAITEVLRSRGTPSGRVGGATRGLHAEKAKPKAKPAETPLASAAPAAR